MIIERKKDKIVIKISPNIDSYGIEKVLEYIDYLELSANPNAKQEDANKLADELNKNWWKENKDRFLK